MPSQKLVLDFEIIILIELVLIQTPLSQKLVQIRVRVNWPWAKPFFLAKTAENCQAKTK